MSIKEILTRLINTVKTLGDRDYIVEQSTSGNWTYRKWYSGIAECWGTFVQSSASFTPTGNIYYRNPGGHNFPFSFIETPAVQASVEMGNVGGCMVIATETKATVYTISAVSQARAITERIYAIGRWK